MKSGMTKAELVKAIKNKGKTASTQVKRVAFRGLEYKTKPQLRGMLRRMRVVKGDIEIL